MKFICSICVLFVLSLPTVAQQDIPVGEIFAGYSYLNVDTNGLSSRQAANGWEAGVDANVSRLFAVEAEANGYYKNYSFDFADLLFLPGASTLHVNVTDYSFMGGPRLNLRPLFVHGLVGVDHLTGSASGVSASQSGLAGAFGGGIELRVSSKVYIRPSVDYVFTRHNIFGGSDFTQNNFRVGVSIVFGFGGVRSGSGSYSRAQRSRASPSGESQEAVLFGIAGVPVDAGVKVTLVRFQSVANRAGVQMGDVIVSMNDNRVRTIRDIEVAIGQNITRSIKVDYLTKGIAAVESTVAVAPPAQ